MSRVGSRSKNNLNAMKNVSLAKTKLHKRTIMPKMHPKVKRKNNPHKRKPTQPLDNKRSPNCNNQPKINSWYRIRTVSQSSTNKLKIATDSILCYVILKCYLEESLQCQFLDIQYMDHFKSHSLIDESLFQWLDCVLLLIVFSFQNIFLPNKYDVIYRNLTLGSTV